MLQFLYKNISLQWFIFIVLLAFSIFVIVTKAQITTEIDTSFLFHFFSNLFVINELTGKGIIIAMLITQTALLQYFFIKKEFISKNSLLPACFYLSILLLTKSFHTISPFFFTILFFLLIIAFDYTASSVKMKNNMFWMGIIIAIATCFDHTAILLLIIAISTLFINQFSKIKEIGILFFGFLLVYFYFFSLYFFTDNLNEWLFSFQRIKVLGISQTTDTINNVKITALLILTIVYFFFIIKFKLRSESKVMVLRKKVVTLNAWALLIIIALFLTNSSYPYALGYLFFPISVYLSLLTQEKNPFYINDLITIITLVSLCL
ncbi:MAG: hypothetical protein LBI45_01420 [Bacteroidales bacterium]|jgi:hypothetical protein|nr:hypothetical protein [Bacteroidales bacterium]